MLLWALMTAMLAAVAAILAAYFLRRPAEDRSQSDEAGGSAVYKDQLEELERDLAAGLMEREQADAARTEIQRRLLACERANGAPAWRLNDRESRLAAIAVSAVVVVGSVGLYGIVGNPQVPSARAVGAPGAARLADQSAVSGKSAAPAIDKMIERIVARLKKKPDDGESWRMLGWSHYAVGRFDKAADAYAKAVALKPSVAALRAMYGEAVVRAAGGQVTKQAAGIFAKTLQLAPMEPRARFFTGLVKEQKGDKTGALQDWQALLKDAGPNDDWTDDLRQRVGELATDIGAAVPVDVAGGTSGAFSTLIADSTSNMSSPPARRFAQARGSSSGGPSDADVRAAQSMSSKDRAAMIRNMVEGLDRRLKTSPRNAGGWIMLIKSRKVLGESGKASAALGRALKVFADDPVEKLRITTAARELGVTP